MIKQIEKIENFGIFKDFRWVKGISEFKRYNLLYGWNYSGKTMLSRLFRVIELRKHHQDFGSVEFILKEDNGNKITEDSMTLSQCQIRVFNTDFIRDNLCWDEQEANPIFVLGEKDIKLEVQLKKLSDEIQQLSGSKTEKENEKSRLEEEVEQKLTAKARELGRIRPPYDKRKLRKTLNEIKDNPQSYYLAMQEVGGLLNTLKSMKKERTILLELSLANEDLINNIEDNLGKTIVSKTIDRLKNNPKLNNWVREGLDIHRGKNRCEFCGSSLPTNILEEYEKHFSEEYEEFIAFSNKLKSTVEEHNQTISSIELPDEKRLYPQLENEYKSAKQEFWESIKKYEDDLQFLIQFLEGKINNPFKRDVQKMPDFQFHRSGIHKTVEEVNQIFSRHNEITDDFEKSQEDAFLRLELHYASEFDENYSYFADIEKLDKFEKEIKNIQEEIEKKEEKIKKINAELSDISKAADRVNNYLLSIFGKEHLKIEPTEKNKFQILRGKEKAKNLSEGEKTAIAFSYFLTRLEDKETDIANTIIFIDDPISSLDSAHLYNTFAVIQSKLAPCKQLFISTHNLEFFNLIKEWLKKIRGCKDKCSFYLIERISKSGEEIADIRELPKTLLDYKSEYHFLFYKIKSFADNPTTDFENLFQLPNILRRFLEAFVGFKYGVGLKKGLEFLITNESDRIKIDKFVNILSHQTGLQRNLIFSDTSECKRVVNIVIGVIKNKDSEHFRSLERIYKDAAYNEADLASCLDTPLKSSEAGLQIRLERYT